MVQKYFYICLVITTTALLAACSNSPAQPPSSTGKYAPEVNPNPKYFMTLKRYLEPQLKAQHSIDNMALALQCKENSYVAYQYI